MAYVAGVGIALLIIGAFVALIGGVLKAAKQNYGKGCTVPVKAQVTSVDARVIETHTSRSSRTGYVGTQRSTFYYPTYRYTLDGQNVIEIEQPFGDSKQKVQTGEVVDLLVNPQDASKIAILGDNSIGFVALMWIGIALLAIGAICTAAGFLL